MKHLSESEINRYVRRAMAPGELIAADDHLAECVRCDDLLMKAGRIAAAYELVRSNLAEAETEPLNPLYLDQPLYLDHPLYEEMVDYIENRLEVRDLEAIETHLLSCEECDADVADIRKLSSLIESADKAGQASSFDAESLRGRGPGLIERLQLLWRLPEYRIPVRVGLAIAAVALLLFAGSFLLLGSRIGSLRGQVTLLETENRSLAERLSGTDTIESSVAALREENERLRRLAAPSSVVLTINDGSGKLLLDQDGRVLGLPNLPQHYQELIGSALGSGRTEIARVPATNIGRIGTVLGEQETQESFKLLSPVGTVVESDSPEFAWQALPGAESYAVFIKEVGSNREIESQLLRATSWTPPERLSRGRTYVWMVEAVKAGKHLRSPSPKEPFASFKILGESQLGELRRARASWGGSHLLMGLLYARAGLKKEAHQELTQLLKANPEADSIRKLARSVSTAR